MPPSSRGLVHQAIKSLSRGPGENYSDVILRLAETDARA
jgi:hypothetical protein